MSQLLKRLRARISDGSRDLSRLQVDTARWKEGGLLLEGKNALVTAAGRNIGEGIAVELATHGANVCGTDNDSSRVRRLQEKLSGFAGRTMAIESDVTDHASSQELCDAIWSSLGHLDILVNNAGMKIKSRFVGNENLESDWHRVYQTNVFGPLSLTRHVCERMIAEDIRGTVLFVSSIHRDSVLGRAHYSSSKAALGMVVKELALELAPYGIRVNALAPGFVETTPSGNVVPHRPTPLWGTSIHPEYVGRAAVYLASDYFSRFTTGSVLQLDAGLSLVNYLDLPRK